MEVNANEVEFLSPNTEGNRGSEGGNRAGSFAGSSASGGYGYGAAAAPHQEAMNLSSGADYMEVEPDDLPF